MTSSTAVGRVEIEQIVGEVGGVSATDLAFAEPWEIRIFALAVAAHRAGQFEWPQFQAALIDSIREWEASHPDVVRDDDPSWSYYEHWTAALETVTTDSGALDTAQIDDRTNVVLDTPPDRDHHVANPLPVAISPATV